MSTTREDIRGWLEEGLRKEATHVLVVCDTFDYDDYPVFVPPSKSIREVVTHYQDEAPTQRIMEIYNLALPIEDQLSEYRAWHL